MISKDLAGPLVDELLYFFQRKECPSRSALVDRVKQNHRELVHPKLDLEIGMALNHLVKTGVLRRFHGKFYAPGEDYCKPV